MSEESGTPYTAEECRRCGKKDAKGISYMWEGGLEFKCDHCGKLMLLGETEENVAAQIQRIRDNEKAKENRDKYFGELETKLIEDIKEAQESLESPPDMIKHFKPMLEGINFDEAEKEKMRRDLAGKNQFDTVDKPFTI